MINCGHFGVIGELFYLILGVVSISKKVVANWRLRDAE